MTARPTLRPCPKNTVSAHPHPHPSSSTQATSSPFSARAQSRCPVPVDVLLRIPRLLVTTYSALSDALVAWCPPPSFTHTWYYFVAIFVGVFDAARRAARSYCVIRISLVLVLAPAVARILALLSPPLPPTLPPLLSAPTPPPSSCSLSAHLESASTTAGLSVLQTAASGLTPPAHAPPPGTPPALPSHNRPPPPDPTSSARPQTYPTLTYSSLNVGGVEITRNRLCHLLGGYQQLPHTISLQEYRPSSLSTTRDHERVARYWGYHLLISSPSSKEGVALLIHTSIAPTAPVMKVHIPGRLISAQL